MATQSSIVHRRDPNIGDASAKPEPVILAQRLLWIWVAWTVVYGLYQTVFPSVADLQPVIDELRPVFEIDTGSLRMFAAVGYSLVAISIAWLIVKIGQGKPWSRTSLLVSAVLQVLWELGQAPGESALGLITDIPDLGLQLAAVVLLYTAPARPWFRKRS